MTQPANDTPASLGYHMPAEWEPHDSTWIAWPHNREDWPGKFAPIPWVCAEIVKHLSLFEPVHILVNGGAARAQWPRSGSIVPGVDLDRVHFHKIRTDRVWTRDTGPTFVVNPNIAQTFAIGMVNWRFNGWAKYDNHTRDELVPRKIAKGLGWPRWEPAVEVDGRSRCRRFVLEGERRRVPCLRETGRRLTRQRCAGLLLTTAGMACFRMFRSVTPGMTREMVTSGSSRTIWKSIDEGDLAEQGNCRRRHAWLHVDDKTCRDFVNYRDN